MTTLNFCGVCGDKKVRDVKEQLERLLTLKEFSPVVCNICGDPISSVSHASSEVVQQQSAQNTQNGHDEESLQMASIKTEHPNISPPEHESGDGDCDEAMHQDDDVTKTEEDEDHVEKVSDASLHTASIKTEHPNISPPEQESSDGDCDEAMHQDDDVTKTEEDEDDDVAMTEDDDDEEYRPSTEDETDDDSGDECDTKKKKTGTETVETTCTSEYSNKVVDDAHFKLKTETETVETTSTFEYIDKVVDDAQFKLKSLRPELAKISEVVRDKRYPFKCKLCQAKHYNAMNTLIYHLSSHFEKKEWLQIQKKPYQCYKCCDKQFKLLREWRRHVGVYQCRDLSCRKRFDSKISFMIHEKQHSASDLRAYKCSQCKKEFLTNGSLRGHLLNVHPEMEIVSIESESVGNDDLQNKLQGESTQGTSNNQVNKYKCSKCHRRFKTEDTLLGHMRTFHCTPIERLATKEEQDGGHITDQSGNTQITGNVQGAVEMMDYQDLKEQKNEDVKIQKSSLRLELKELLEDDKTDGTMFKCGKCNNTSFDSPKLFIIHAASHVGDAIAAEPYQCNRCCSETFQSFQKWRIHVRPHKCTIADCNYRAPTRSIYNTHFTRVHTNAERKFKCDLCPAAFHRNYDLTEHTKKVHEKIKRFTCRFCGYQCFTRHEINRHEQIHTKEKPFHCDICGQAYATAKRLKLHKMDHTGEKPYVCYQCGFATKNKYCLRDHEKLHSKVMKYKCDICGIQKHKKILMDRHKRKHTGERPFQCRFCSKCFMIKPTRNCREASP